LGLLLGRFLLLVGLGLLMLLLCLLLLLRRLMMLILMLLLLMLLLLLILILILKLLLLLLLILRYLLLSMLLLLLLLQIPPALPLPRSLLQDLRLRTPALLEMDLSSIRAQQAIADLHGRGLLCDVHQMRQLLQEERKSGSAIPLDLGKDGYHLLATC
jgi:hypothetical protein